MFDILLNNIEKLWQSSSLSFIKKDNDMSLKTKTYITKIHTKQRSNWDCGIACLSMAGKWSSNCENDLYDNIIDNEISIRTTPLWTIDLYCFLKDNNIDSIMYTRTIGISSTHSQFGWYQNYLSDDSNRVSNKFQLAKEKCWIIHDIIVDLNDVADKILNGSAAIILVDNYLLHNSNKNYNDDDYNYHYNSITNEEKSNEETRDYAGHYIFLLEYDPSNKMFTYLDPALNACVVTVSFDILEKSRSHVGTDYDIIIINKQEVIET